MVVVATFEMILMLILDMTMTMNVFLIHVTQIWMRRNKENAIKRDNILLHFLSFVCPSIR